MDLGNRIRELRKARGLSQEALAERMGVSRQAVAKWEDNQSRPSTANLIELSKFFEVDLNELVGSEAFPAAELTEDIKKRSARRKRLWWLLFISTAVLLVTALSMSVTTIFGAVGVIGGADGPTQIFVGGHSILPYVVCAVCVVTIIVSTVLLVKTRYHENGQHPEPQPKALKIILVILALLLIIAIVCIGVLTVYLVRTDSQTQKVEISSDTETMNPDFSSNSPESLPMLPQSTPAPTQKPQGPNSQSHHTENNHHQTGSVHHSTHHFSETYISLYS